MLLCKVALCSWLFSGHLLLITKPTDLFIISKRLCMISLWSVVRDERVTPDTKTLKTGGKSGTSESDFLEIVRLCSSVCILNLRECVCERRERSEREREDVSVFWSSCFFSPDMTRIPSALPFLTLIVNHTGHKI